MSQFCVLEHPATVHKSYLINTINFDFLDVVKDIYDYGGKSP